MILKKRLKEYRYLVKEYINRNKEFKLDRLII